MPKPKTLKALKKSELVELCRGNGWDVVVCRRNNKSQLVFALEQDIEPRAKANAPLADLEEVPPTRVRVVEVVKPKPAKKKWKNPAKRPESKCAVTRGLKLLRSGTLETGRLAGFQNQAGTVDENASWALNHPRSNYVGVAFTLKASKGVVFIASCDAEVLDIMQSALALDCKRKPYTEHEGDYLVAALHIDAA